MKKTANSQTHFGFTNIGSDTFRVTAIWSCNFWFGSPCTTIISGKTFLVLSSLKHLGMALLHYWCILYNVSYISTLLGATYFMYICKYSETFMFTSLRHKRSSHTVPKLYYVFRLFINVTKRFTYHTLLDVNFVCSGSQGCTIIILIIFANLEIVQITTINKLNTLKMRKLFILVFFRTE